MDLPILSPDEAPIRHADCCLSLSTTLLEVLANVFCDKHLPASKRIVLSIGSGTGLLEALLLAYIQSRPLGPNHSRLENLGIEGVEVHELGSTTHLNKYLPEYATNRVRGTWEMSPRIRDGDVPVLMFTYPRQAALVSQYVQAAQEPDLGIELMVWLGPVADWDEYEPCFRHATKLNQKGFKLQSKWQGIEAGIGDYEMMAVFRR